GEPALQRTICLPGAVRDDDMQPGAELRAALEAMDVPGDLEEDILGGLLRVLAVRQEACAAPEHLGLDPAEQRIKGRAVAGGGPLGKLFGVVHGVPLPPGTVRHHTGVSRVDRIGRYAVERRLGSGAFALVWLGRDDVLEAPVAIKVLAENWAHQLDVR